MERLQRIVETGIFLLSLGHAELMLLEMLSMAGMRYKVLNYDNLANKSRYAQISFSPTVREMLMVACEGDCNATTGRTKLEERIRKMGLERRHPDYDFFRKKAHQSTFYETVRWLEENHVISIVPKRRIKGGGFQNTYCLEGNILLFRNSKDDWIPSVIFVCPQKLFTIEGSDATEQNIIRLLPSDSICEYCHKKAECEIHKSLSRMVTLRNDKLGIPK